MAKILVIEDENIIRETVLDTLELENYQASGARNGIEGLQVLESFQPDLVICDVMMNGLDGYGVLEAVRSNPKTNTIPFVFVTAKADRESIRHGMQLGADDYLTKPFTASELLETIAVRLERHQQIAQSAAPQNGNFSPELVGAINNELHTPLCSINATLETISRQVNHIQPSELQTLLDAVQVDSQRLDHSIRQLTLLTRLESGELGPDAIQATGKQKPVWELIMTATSLARSFANEHTDVSVKLTDSDAEMSVWCDSKSLKHALAEVIANALQVAPPHTEIVISQWMAQGVAWIEVADYGTGLAEAQVAALLDDSRAVPVVSTLGIHLARRIVEAHGGQLKIDSAEEEGTRVLIGLPAVDTN